MRKKPKALALATAAAQPPEDGDCDPAAALVAKREVDVNYADSTATTHAVIRTEDSADTVTQARKEITTTQKKRPPGSENRRLDSVPIRCFLSFFLPLYLTELEINFAVYRNKSRPTFRKRFVGNRTGSRSKR